MDKRNESAGSTLLGGSKAAFDEAVESLDGATRAKLRAARARALEELRPRALGGGARLWIPAAVAAGVVALMALPMLERDGTGAEADFETMTAADLEILLGEEELEMLAELEFFEWLDLQDAEETGGESADGVG